MDWRGSSLIFVPALVLLFLSKLEFGVPIDSEDSQQPPKTDSVADASDEVGATDAPVGDVEAAASEVASGDASAEVDSEVDSAEAEDEGPKKSIAELAEEGVARVRRGSHQTDYDDDDDDDDVEPIEALDEVVEEEVAPQAEDMRWYILKVSVNRETTVADSLLRRVKMQGMEASFGEIIVPVEEVTEFTKAGKKRKVKKKLYPGYIVVQMAINDDTWFLVRETGGIGDFTGAIGKPAPLPDHEVDRILDRAREPEPGAELVHNIAFKVDDRVRVTEGNFQSFDGVVVGVDQNTGEVEVEIMIFNRTTPVGFKHWQLEAQ